MLRGKPGKSRPCVSPLTHGRAHVRTLQVEKSIMFGHHQANDNAKTLRNYSHNGIGTKACLNFFSNLARRRR